jgi:hypothetical protein
VQGLKDKKSMINEQELEFIKQNKRFKRTIFNSIDYGFMMFPIALILIGLGLIFGFFPCTRIEQIFLTPIALTIGVLLFFFFKNRIDHNTKYFELQTGKKQIENIELSKLTLEKDIDSKEILINKEFGIVNTTTGIGLTSWGETVTIICFDNYILINSKPHGFLTINEDKLNIKRIKEGIAKRIKNPST